jgi:hypothetical protein
MQFLIEHPAVQAGVAPFLVALAVAALLSRTRFPWLALVAAYVTMVMLGPGFSFTPLSAGRKLALMLLLAPPVGIVCDLLAAKSKRLPAAVAIVAAGASAWVFQSVLEQRDPGAALATGVGVAAFVAAMCWLVLRHRDDGIATGAAGIGLGLAAGVAALLSASIGYFMAGVALAAGSAALLIVQAVRGRAIAAGYTGALTLGIGTALFAAASLVLAQLPWYALPLLLLVPAVAWLPIGRGLPPLRRAAVLTLAKLAAAAAPVTAAWLATMSSAQ